MSYEFYKVLHLLGILALFTSLGGLTMLFLRGGTDDELKSMRKLLMGAHGVALAIILVAGFGLMARKSVGTADGGWPLWIYLKLGAWLVFGALATAVKKMRASWWYAVVPLLGAAAAYLAIVKPA